ncbi:MULTISPECIES: RNA polymerase sigma factor [Parabacteroides]|uniref:RNA polymerase sigma-70 factor, ECF subfamily n=1 Tax=Parabacteroides chinchillae TaxID=871327 RepID=A0A8G2BWV7_9BACT|nr:MULTISPECIES: sigma factor-like helix-turn-helix DNA-binding protein [Parabacteroides]SEF94668.1 RNA polymerase sigma-70 factor, ECF subfamily [Parabacteroides chinchillae]
MENNKDALKGRIIVAMRNIFVSEYRKIVNKYADQQIWTDIDLSSDAVFSSSTTNSYSMQDVSKALRSISNELKVPFSLFISGYKYEEIAKHLNIPVGTVKSRIYFARQALHKVLSNDKDDSK